MLINPAFGGYVDGTEIVVGRVFSNFLSFCCGFCLGL